MDNQRSETEPARSTSEWQDYVATHLRVCTQRMDEFEAKLREQADYLAKNTEAINRIESNTSDIVEAFASLQGAFKVLNWLGKAIERTAKPITVLITLGLAIWGVVVALKGGK